MTVRISKPSIDLRSKLSELERPIGLKGNELFRAETAQDARDLVSAGRKNLIINGDMRIAQRGTSGQKPSNGYGGYLSVDRWAVYYQHSTIAQTDVTINGQSKKACRVTASSSYGRAYVYQKIENLSRLVGDGTPFSISFWARASRPEKRRLNWRYYDSGTENNGSSADITNIYIDTQWKHYKIENVSIIDANYNGTRDGGLWLFNALGDDIGTGFWFEFTEVQIEIGKNATEFEHRSYGEELALCQRYYEVIDNYYASAHRGLDNNYDGHTTITGPVYAVTKRTGPTVTISNVYGWIANNSGWTSGTSVNINGTQYVNQAGITGRWQWTGDSTSQNTTGVRLTIKADAEL